MILDDVWERFDLEEVGILVRVDGFKLVLTTRSFDVCRQMHCQVKIKIESLSQEEAESLFMEKLGFEVELNLETEAVAKSIVEECASLSLGVIMMAASMRGVTDVFEWKGCLVKLKESDMGETYMEKKVLTTLKFSYNRLGLIGGLNMREKQYDRGLTLLNKLGNVCLLEDNGSEMKMHVLIRDMALRIMSTTSIVKVGNG
ncbi:hypothetical protein NL676_024303 [Syzygium grande]|nr:hypothetical protein NL676_024303 [Syzygium grande]